MSQARLESGGSNSGADAGFQTSGSDRPRTQKKSKKIKRHVRHLTTSRPMRRMRNVVFKKPSATSWQSPSFTWRRFLMFAWVFALASMGAVMSFTGCQSISDDPCASTKECKKNGRCARIQGRCIAAVQTHCESSQICAQEGRCSAVEGRCVAKEAADCQTRSNVCVEHGFCQVRGGQCVAREYMDCRTAQDQVQDADRSWRTVPLCSGLGHCKPVEGRCQATSDTDCASAFICREWGRCRTIQGTCLAQTDADCRRSRACREVGACRAKSGRCVRG